MATRAEMQDRWDLEFKTLKSKWMELFNSGTEEEVEVQAKLEHQHVPPGIKVLVEEIVDETHDFITARLQKVRDENVDENVDEEDIANMGYNYALEFARLMSVRMYRMGQALNGELPFDQLTPCTCTTIADDDLEAFLNEDYSPEGRIVRNAVPREDQQ